MMAAQFPRKTTQQCLLGLGRPPTANTCLSGCVLALAALLLLLSFSEPCNGRHFAAAAPATSRENLQSNLRSHFHGVLPTKGLPLQQERDHEEEGSLGSAEEEDEALHEILHHFDLDEDGQLSFSEFEAWFIILFPFSVHDHDHDHDEDHDHDHDHDEEASHAHEEEPHEVAVSRRRVAPLTREQASRALPIITLSSYTATQTKRQQESEEEEGHADCHTAEEVFHLYDINENEALNETEIHAACPLLLMMVTEGCYSEEEGHDGGSKCSEPDAWQAWLATLGSVCILSLLALVGIVLLFLVSANQQIRHYVMMAMVSFAVGALVADAVLHLIPHALEVHSHEEGEGHDHGGHAHEEEEEEDKEYLAVATMVLIGVLVFFMTEKLLLVVLGHDGHNHTLTVDEELDRPALEDDDGEDSSSSSSSSADMEMAEVKCEPDKPCDVCSSGVKGDGGRGRGFVSRQAKQMRKVKAFGWLNLLADGLHNLIDGVALGAAYSQSLTLGFSTTLAVAFHEIPQELGDYVILLRAGFNQYTALFWNFLSACLSIIGAFIGLAVGQSSTDGEKWILAFTAGGFLYIALADMVPELNKDRAPSSDSSSSTGQRGADWWAVLLQLAGILLGFGILAILAVWEEDIISC